jgi:hypothetical protein
MGAEIDWTFVLCNEVERGLPQREIAKTYALALRSEAAPDWPTINRAILARWELGGLKRIKHQAWRLAGEADALLRGNG